MKDLAVVYKYSALESYSAKHIRRHREINPDLSRRMESAHEDHARASERLTQVISELGINATYFERDGLGQNLDGFRLVISIGGDGTFINASHYIERTLLLGINSSPAHSVGHYCRFNLKSPRSEADLKKKLVAIFAAPGRLKEEVSLLRMRLAVSGRLAPFAILNDALFCEENPAATSRYTLEYQDRTDHQKSSGLWISTPTGSTAAYSSAGGKAFKTRELRFVVRELYSGKIRAGKIPAREQLGIVSSMKHGALYLDGSHHKMPVHLGEHITISAHPQSLRAIY